MTGQPDTRTIALRCPHGCGVKELQPAAIRMRRDTLRPVGKDHVADWTCSNCCRNNGARLSAVDVLLLSAAGVKRPIDAEDAPALLLPLGPIDRTGEYQAGALLMPQATPCTCERCPR